MRNLFALTALAILWIRQIRYERRLSDRQGRWEREAAREFERFGEQNWRWSERLVKQINKALRQR